MIRPGRRKAAVADHLSRLKLRAIDAAVAIHGPSTLADLGGVWAVDGGYALYALDHHDLERVTICDFEFTDPARERAAADPRVILREGDFTTPEAVAAVGAVDAILMFDILLHQVDPDWRQVLARYAPSTGCLILAGPWWNGPGTVRLLDLGPEEYLRLVPLPEFHAPILERLDEVNPERGKPWRDVPDIWQWGIGEDDLRACLDDLGFRLAFHENAGSWMGSESFDDCSYVFVRDQGSPAG